MTILKLFVTLTLNSDLGNCDIRIHIDKAADGNSNNNNNLKSIQNNYYKNFYSNTLSYLHTILKCFPNFINFANYHKKNT